MGFRLVLLVPKLPTDLERPTPLMMRKALDQVVGVCGGALIETRITLDENFDGLYETIEALPSIAAPCGFRDVVYDDQDKPSLGTVTTSKDGSPLRMVESHQLGIALSSERAGKTWRNHAAERFFNALPPGLPVFLYWE